MTPEERALLNEETVLGTEDRFFCGIELGEITLASRRYIERVVSWYASARATPKEVALVYAFLLTLEIGPLRLVAREMQFVEEALDVFITSRLPDPIPAEEIAKLNALLERDTARLKAAQVEVVEKPGAKVDPDTPPNS